MTYPYCIWLEAHKSKCRQINKKTYCSYYEYHVLPRAPRKNQYFSLDLTAQERSTSSSWPCLAIMTDTYKLLDLGRQILVSLISRVSSLDLKINNVSVYLISLLLFCSLSGTLSTNIKPERESCGTFRLASFHLVELNEWWLNGNCCISIQRACLSLVP